MTLWLHVNRGDHSVSSDREDDVVGIRFSSIVAIESDEDSPRFVKLRCIDLTECRDAAIPECCFRCLPALQEVRVSSYLRILQGWAFDHCPCLREFIALELQSVGESAFAYCSGLQRVVLPKARIISTEAFVECSSLAQIDVPACVAVGNEAFRSCALESIVLPNCLTLGYFAFGYSKLRAIDAPRLRQIGDEAFRLSCLDRLVLSDNVAVGRDILAEVQGFSRIEVGRVIAIRSAGDLQLGLSRTIDTVILRPVPEFGILEQLLKNSLSPQARMFGSAELIGSVFAGKKVLELALLGDGSRPVSSSPPPEEKVPIQDGAGHQLLGSGLPRGEAIHGGPVEAIKSEHGSCCELA